MNIPSVFSAEHRQHLLLVTDISVFMIELDSWCP